MIPTDNFPMKLENTSLIQIRFFSDVLEYSIPFAHLHKL